MPESGASVQLLDLSTYLAYRLHHESTNYIAELAEDTATLRQESQSRFLHAAGQGCLPILRTQSADSAADDSDETIGDER